MRCVTMLLLIVGQTRQTACPNSADVKTVKTVRTVIIAMIAVDSYCNVNDLLSRICNMPPRQANFSCTLEPRCALSPSPGYYTQIGLAELSQSDAENPRLLRLSEWGEQM